MVEKYLGLFGLFLKRRCLALSESLPTQPAFADPNGDGIGDPDLAQKVHRPHACPCWV